MVILKVERYSFGYANEAQLNNPFDIKEGDVVPIEDYGKFLCTHRQLLNVRHSMVFWGRNSFKEPVALFFPQASELYINDDSRLGAHQQIVESKISRDNLNRGYILRRLEDVGL